MARLPRYRRLGVEADRPAQLDFANLREQQRLAQTVSQQVDQMGDFVYRRASERAARQGVEAVEEQGARPILERIAAAGGPTTIPEQAAFEAANRIAVAEIQMEADQQISQLLQTAQQNMTPFSEVQTQLSDVVDGYAATLSTLDPQAAGLLRVRLQENTGRANTRYASWYQGQMRAAASRRVGEWLNTQAEEGVAFAISEGATAENIAEYAENVFSTLVDQGYSESRARTAADSILGDMRDNFNVAVVNRASPQELVAISQTPPPIAPEPGLDLVETNTLHNRRVAAANARLQVHEADARLLIDQMSESAEVLNSGGYIPTETMIEYRERVNDPVMQAVAPEVLNAYRQLARNRSFMDHIRALTLSELQELHDEISSQGSPSAGLPGFDTEIERIQLRQLEAQIRIVQRTREESLRQAQEDAMPSLGEMQTGLQLLDTALSGESPNFPDAVLAIDTFLEAAEQVPQEIMDDDQLDQIEQIRQLSTALEEWEQSSSPELRDELQRLRDQTAVDPNTLPEGVTVAEQRLMNMQRAALLEGFMATQVQYIQEGRVLEYMRNQNMTRSGEEIGRPINFDVMPGETSSDMSARISAEIANRQSDLVYAESRFGASGQNILLDSEIAQFNAVIQYGQPGQQAALIQTIAENFSPQEAQSIYTSLDLNDSRVISFVQLGSLASLGRIDLVAQATQGMAQPQVSIEGLNENTMRETSDRSYLGASLANSPQLRQGIVQVARLLARNEVAMRGEVSPSDYQEIYTQALADASANLQIVDIGDERVALAHDFDAEAITSFFEDPPARIIPGLVLNAEEAGDYNPQTIVEEARAGNVYPMFAGAIDGNPVYEIMLGAGTSTQVLTSVSGQRLVFDLSHIGADSLAQARIPLPSAEVSADVSAEQAAMESEAEVPAGPEQTIAGAGVSLVQRAIEAIENRPPLPPGSVVAPFDEFEGMDTPPEPEPEPSRQEELDALVTTLGQYEDVIASGGSIYTSDIIDLTRAILALPAAMVPREVRIRAAELQRANQ